MTNIAMINKFLNDLHYGKQVHVSDNQERWFIHWFERISSKGFCTTEGQGKAYRLMKAFNLFAHREIVIDFNEIKQYFESIKE